MNIPSQNKLLVIAGPTAAGKSDLAITLAKEYDGEVISADSRQVYIGMDVGTGKVERDFPVISNSQFLISNEIQDLKSKTKNPNTQQGNQNLFFSEGIAHHLIDIADPKEEYNVSHFVHDAEEAIAAIRESGHLPIICGGTHFWIETLLAGGSLPSVAPDPALREELSKHSLEELFAMLEEKDPARAASIDKHNKIRLIRALEIIESLGKVPPLCHSNASLCHPELVEGSALSMVDSSTRGLARNDNVIIIALSPDKETLRSNIKVRLEKRMDQGMVEEVARLHTEGVSWERLENFGLEYRYVALMLQDKLTREQMLTELETAIWHYAKRQLSFLRRLERSGWKIHWISTPQEAEPLLSER